MLKKKARELARKENKKSVNGLVTSRNRLENDLTGKKYKLASEIAMKEGY